MGLKNSNENKVKSSFRNVGEKGRNNFLFYLYYFLFSISIRPFLRLKVKRNIKKLDKPGIILCNHGSFTDFFYTGIILHKFNPRYVTARLYFYNKFANSILRSVGCFPKSMFTSDIENAKNCVKVINGGNLLVLMPEARLSTVGKFEDIQDSTLKFIRKMNVNVYTLTLKGDYFAYPKWSTGLRFFAPVECELSVLFKKDEPMQLSQEEFDAKVIKSLDYNEFEWIKTRPEIEYKKKTLAEGLENILYVCPKCGKTLTILTKGRKVYCSECDFETILNNRYSFDNCRFENFQQWYDYQLDLMREEVKNPEFKLESKVKLMHSAKKFNHQIRLAGEGVCTLTKDGLTYKGTDDGKEIEKFFSLKSIYRVLFGAGEDFELYEGSEIYYFVPDDKRSCVIWYVASTALKEIY